MVDKRTRGWQQKEQANRSDKVNTGRHFIALFSNMYVTVYLKGKYNLADSFLFAKSFFVVVFLKAHFHCQCHFVIVGLRVAVAKCVYKRLKKSVMEPSSTLPTSQSDSPESFSD